MTFQHARAEVRDGRLHFETTDGWDSALSNGFFYLKSPDDINFSPGVHFCESYHLERTGGADDAYRGFRRTKFEGSKLGYSDTGNDQVERVQLELDLWERHLPPDVLPMLHRLNDLARVVVHNFFSRCGVKASHVAQVTGGMDTNEALQYCIFNNYESKKTAPDGFTAHKDSGFIQLMHSTEPGLEARQGDRWVPVDPIPGYLTAINGHSLEILTARMPVRAAASYHRVRNIELRGGGRKDRMSLGVYIGPKFEQDLYQYDEDGNLTRLQSFMSFQRQKAEEMGYEFASIHANLADGKRQPAETQASK